MVVLQKTIIQIPFTHSIWIQRRGSACIILQVLIKIRRIKIQKNKNHKQRLGLNPNQDLIFRWSLTIIASIFSREKIYRQILMISGSLISKLKGLLK